MSPPRMQQLALDIGLAPVPTLENFIDAGNEAAAEHVRLWANNPLRSPVPTLLWGDSGSGKCHAHSLAHLLRIAFNLVYILLVVSHKALHVGFETGRISAYGNQKFCK